MYVPASFRETRREVLFGLIRDFPLALLVSHGADGLQASPLPFHLAADEGESGVLRAHMARANPHWRALAGADECLVSFQGPQGYVSPSWYPGKAATHRVVPTWNYATVQVWGRPRVIEDADWLRRQLDELTAAHEQSRTPPWMPADAPADFLAMQMKAIVGLEIPIARIEGKFKLSQNREAADRAGVAAGAADAGDPHYAPAMAEMVRERLGE